MKIKKVAMMVMVATMLLSVAGTASALHWEMESQGDSYKRELTIIVNGNPIKFEGQKPMMINGKTMVPVRDLAIALDCTAVWSESDRSVEVYCHYCDASLEWKIGENTYTTGHGDTVDAGCAPVIVNNQTFVPLRAIAESVGHCSVQFIPKKYGDIILVDEKF